MARKSRQISEAERKLWQTAMSSTEPLAARDIHTPALLAPPSPTAAQPGKSSPRVRAEPSLPPGAPQRFRPGEAAPLPPARLDRGTDPAARLAAQPAAMDQRRYQRLRRGKLEPEARLDLHGMTLARAHGALRGFILRAEGAGLRVLLVITGKGRGADAERPLFEAPGALRHQVPDWLATMPLAEFVLQVLPAHRSHGGSGAYYVVLRRRRA